MLSEEEGPVRNGYGPQHQLEAGFDVPGLGKLRLSMRQPVLGYGSASLAGRSAVPACGFWDRKRPMIKREESRTGSQVVTPNRKAEYLELSEHSASRAHPGSWRITYL
jgi:hypothetical protein